MESKRKFDEAFPVEENSAGGSGVSTIQQTDNELLTETDATSLLCLNDDCLIEILRYLNIDDLSSVASTCTQLKSSARDVFRTYHTSKTINIEAILYHESNKVHHIPNILRNFGDLARVLNYEFSRESSQTKAAVMKLIDKYCASVEELMIVDAYGLIDGVVTDGPIFYSRCGNC